MMDIYDKLNNIFIYWGEDSELAVNVAKWYNLPTPEEVGLSITKMNLEEQIKQLMEKIKRKYGHP